MPMRMPPSPAPDNDLNEEVGSNNAQAQEVALSSTEVDSEVPDTSDLTGVMIVMCWKLCRKIKKNANPNANTTASAPNDDLNKEVGSNNAQAQEVALSSTEVDSEVPDTSDLTGGDG